MTINDMLLNCIPERHLFIVPTILVERLHRMLIPTRIPVVKRNVRLSAQEAPTVTGQVPPYSPRTGQHHPGSTAWISLTCTFSAWSQKESLTPHAHASSSANTCRNT